MKTLLLLLASVSLCFAQTDVATRLQALSVTVHTESGQGSGAIITRDGINFILTAGHVVSGNRKVVSVIDNGKTRYESRFTPVTITREIYVEGRSVGETTVEADVIAYSSADDGHDLALLKLRSSIGKESIEFYPERLAPVGTDLVHVGSLNGQMGSNSFTIGILSQVGRVHKDKVFDQTSCTAFPGSSGGGVYLRSNGQYVGTLVRGAGENFNLIVPVRRIREWAKALHIEFIFDPKAKPDLDKIKLEDGELAPEPASANPFAGITLGRKRASFSLLPWDLETTK